MGSELVYYTTPKRWRPELALLSFFVSFLGAYTTTQLLIQANGTKRTSRVLIWLALAATSFGGTGVWCMHFVAMLAIDIGIERHYALVRTVFTAVIAVLGTFLTFLINIPPPERSTSSQASRLWHSFYNLLSRRTWSALLGKPRINLGAYDMLDREESSSYQSDLSLQNDTRSEERSSTLDSDSIHRDFDIRAAMTSSTPATTATNLAGLLEVLRLGCTLRTMVSAAMLGLVVFTMHFLGMRAMLFDGRIRYNGFFVVLTYVEGSLASLVALIYMPTDSDTKRQSIFSLVAAVAVSGLHYIGMYAATFETTQAPPYTAVEVNYTLAACCAAIAIMTCFISYAFLAHAVADHKHRLQGYIQTRKELWKATAERRAFERSNRLKSEFIATASHELRTPLYSISGYSELLQTTNLDPEQRAYVDLIKSATKALSLITDSVLDFSKLENDNSESQAKPTKVHIRKLIYDCVRQCYMRKDHRSSQVTLLCIIDEQVPETCWIDEVYISRVVFNLCGNALKFTSEGYGTHCDNSPEEVADTLVIVSLSLGATSQDLMLQCIDSGIGIPQANLEDIFKPFRQVDNLKTRKFNGTGLGLAISLQLMHKLGGTMAVKSSQEEKDPERGSCFTCVFPNTSVEDAHSALGSNLHVPAAVPEVLTKLPKTNRKPLTYIHRQRRCHPALVTVLEDEFDLHGVALESISRHYLPHLDQRVLTEIECFEREQVRRLFDNSPSDKVWFICFDEDAANTLNVDIKSLQKQTNVILLRRPICIHQELFNQLDARKPQDAHNTLMEDTNLGMSERTNPILPVTRDRARDESRINQRSVKFALLTEEGLQAVSPVDDVASDLGSKSTQAMPDSIELSTNGDLMQKDASSTPIVEQPCILLVEDNKVNSKLGMAMLKKCGMKAAAAENGQEAIDLIFADPARFALVLMDCQMPVMDGFTATRKIRAWELDRKRGEHIPIVALTANVSEAAEKECLEAGADKFLPKPLTMKNLKDEVSLRIAHLL